MLRLLYGFIPPVSVPPLLKRLLPKGKSVIHL